MLRAKAGPVLLSKETFHSNYDQELFVGSIALPVALFVGVGIPLNGASAIWVEAGRSSYDLVSDDVTSVAVHPVLVGYRQRLPILSERSRVLTYFSAGLGYYWARFQSEYAERDESGQVFAVIPTGEDYFGPGAYISLAVNYTLNESTTLGVEVRADYSSVEDPANGGLGQVGGLALLLTLGTNP